MPLVPADATPKTWQLIAVVLFFGIHLVAPWVVGEVYPFTTAPMFREEPKVYCQYKVFDDKGNQLPNDFFGLQMNYDGNPEGYGVGITPPETINKFGSVASDSAVKEMVTKRLQQLPYKSITVERRVIEDIDGNLVGVKGQPTLWRFKKSKKDSPESKSGEPKQ